MRALLPSPPIQPWKAFALRIQNLRLSKQLPRSYLFSNWQIESCNLCLCIGEAFLLLMYFWTHTIEYQGEISLPRENEFKTIPGGRTSSKGKRLGSLDAHSVHFHVSKFLRDYKAGRWWSQDLNLSWVSPEITTLYLQLSTLLNIEPGTIFWVCVRSPGLLHWRSLSLGLGSLSSRPPWGASQRCEPGQATSLLRPACLHL